jgi:flagellar protein FliO/FliZ
MPADPPSFGALLLQLVISLALVCGLAWVIIKFGLARWLRKQASPTAGMEVLETLPLGGRRAIFLVRTLDRLLVVGASEAGLRTLCDMGPGSAHDYDAQTFAQALEEAETDRGDPAPTAPE